MSGRLHGKTAMVTGGGNGIGRTICEVFAREGARVAVLDIDEEAIKKTRELLNHERHCSIKADVTKSDEVAQAFGKAEEAFGRKLDIVINNAGILGNQKSVADTDEADFDLVVNVNLKGVFLVARQYLNSVKTVDAKIRGVLVNMASLAAIRGMRYNGQYAASKAGVVALTKTITREFDIHGVRCNAVLPAFTDTAMASRTHPEYANVKAAIPMGRFATTGEIASACLYLASDESSFVHGVSLKVAGGVA